MAEENPDLAVTLTARSLIALDAAVKLSGDSTVDTVNRALQLYAGVLALADVKGPYSLRFQATKDGERVRVEVNRPRWRFW